MRERWRVCHESQNYVFEHDQGKDQVYVIMVVDKSRGLRVQVPVFFGMRYHGHRPPRLGDKYYEMVSSSSRTDEALITGGAEVGPWEVRDFTACFTLHNVARSWSFTIADMQWLLSS
jgi:hypothetical protein